MNGPLTKQNFILGIILFYVFMSWGIQDLKAQRTIIVGTDIAWSNVSPFVPFARYGYTQQIYPNHWLNFKGDIQKIEIYPYGEAMWSDTVQVFLGQTSKTYFDYPYDWIDPLSLTKVFEGELVFHPGVWCEIIFDSPFYYNGEESLVLAFNNTSDQFYSNDQTGFGVSYNDMGASTKYYYSNDEHFNLEDSQEEAFITYGSLNLRCTGDLNYLYSKREKIRLHHYAASTDTLNIVSSWRNWIVEFESQDWLDVLVDTSMQQIVFRTLDHNGSEKEREVNISVLVSGKDTMNISVIQFPDHGFVSLGDDYENYLFSSKDFGDFDNDGDLDILISGDYSLGENYSDSRIEIYENLGDLNFRKMNHDIFPGFKCRASFQDMNNDNDLDILINGYYYGMDNEQIPLLYYYQKKDGIYIEYSFAGLEQLGPARIGNENHFESVSVFDFNNDGRRDVFISGNNLEEDPQSILMLGNDEDRYELSDIVFPGVDGACHAVEDIDSDGDWDVLFHGEDRSGNSVSYFSENQDGDFVSRRVGIGVSKNLFLSDIDSDRDYEIITSGSEMRFYQTGSLISDPSWYFFTPGSSSQSILEGNFLPGGYGNDYVFAGPDTSYLASSKRYQSNIEIEEGIHVRGKYSGFPGMGDLDSDGDLELFIGSKLYNNCYEFDTVYSPIPDSLWTEIIDGVVYLNWHPGELPPHDSLFSFNISIGYHPDSCNVLSPLSDLETGFRKVVRKGNAGRNTRWKIRDLKPGTYYWRVQSVNSIYQGSQFSALDSFKMYQSYQEMDFLIQEGNDDMGRWVDFDLDGDMDILSLLKSKLFIFRNDSSELIQLDSIEKGFTGFDICDINKDNLPGFMGIRRGEWNYEDTPDTLCFYDQTIEHDFVLIKTIVAELNSIRNSHFTDFNNDGLTDLFLQGYSDYRGTYDPQAISIYSDVFGTATLVSRDNYFSKSEYGGLMSTIVDIDLDGWVDIFVSGYNQIERKYESCLYMNMGDFQFKKQELSIGGYTMSDLMFGDFNNDQYPDLLITGSLNQFGYETALYLNQNGNDLKRVETPLPWPGSIFSHVAANDVNNDGYLDFVMGGQEMITKLRLYVNEGGETFQYRSGYLPTDYQPYSIDFGDLDNDMDNDILFFGRNVQGGFEKIWPNSILRNNINLSNERPGEPDSLIVQKIGKRTSLIWDSPNSGSGIEESYLYNVRVGTTPGGADIICPLSNILSGHVLANHQCNAGYSQLFVLDSLPVGDYYWSVQAVDQNFLGGGWSEEEMFTISFLRAEFSADTVCLGGATKFMEEAVVIESDINEWHWDFGDGKISQEKDPTHIFETSGSFDVKLRISNDIYSDSISREVIVMPKPKPEFQANLVCQGKATTFLNTTDANGTQVMDWLWDFGDSSFFRAENPMDHGYLAAGDYMVTLRVVSDNTCSDSITQQVEVASYPSPVITTNKATSLCQGDSLILSNTFSPEYEYQWKISGFPVTGGDSSSFTVKEPGTYSLEIINRKGACLTQSDTLNVEVYTYPVQPDVLHKNYIYNSCPEPIPIELSIDNFNSDYAYSWIRNGIPIIGAVGSEYTGFLSEGDYSVAAKNKECATESEVLTIKYAMVPEKPELKVYGPTVWYLICLSEAATAYRWYHNDVLIPGADQNLYVVGSIEGKYQVSTASSEEGCFSFSDPVWIPLATGRAEYDHNQVKIYPNPGKGEFVVELNNPLTDPPLIRITSMDGRVVLFDKEHIRAGEQKFSIVLNNESPGIYLLSLISGELKLQEILLLE